MSPQTQAGIDYSKVDEILSTYGYKKSNLIKPVCFLFINKININLFLGNIIYIVH